MNVRRTGEDFRVGHGVLEPGQSIGPATVMALAAIGTGRVRVRRKPRIAILCTGDELRTHGSPGPPGTIADANGPYLASLLPEFGAVVASRAQAGDDPGELRSALLSAADSSDIVVTTGGVSAGSADLLPGALAALGAETLFHKVAIRPGKPVLFGRMPTGVPVLALPGNPLRAALGQPRETYSVARCATAIRRRGDLVFFAKARCRLGAGTALQVELLPGQESFKISPLLSANCWAIVPPGSGSIDADEAVDVAPLSPGRFPSEG
jgi:molybdopterin molybdotransferase